MKNKGLQQGKTRWTHYQTGYHLVWIPKYRKKVLVGEVQKELKALIHTCADKHGFSVIAVETDIDHVHVFVSAPPRFSPAWLANLLKGYTARMLREKFPVLKKKCGRDKLWTSAYYARNCRAGFVGNDHSLYHGMPRKVKHAFISIP